MKSMSSRVWCVKSTRLKRRRRLICCSLFQSQRSLGRVCEWISLVALLMFKVSSPGGGRSVLKVWCVHPCTTGVPCRGSNQHFQPECGDTRFTGRFWTALLNMMGSELKFYTANHPQIDGQTERRNGLVEDYLRHYVTASQKNWVNLLDSAQFSYNLHKSSAKG